jgi:Cu/Ag efflux protein CusF
MKFVTLVICAFCIGVMNTSAALADNLGQNEDMRMDMRNHGDAQPLSEGTVKKVNASGKITIVHGPLANLGMPPMTMTFGVKDTALLRGIKPGDRVRFRAEQAADGLIVTRLIVIR